MNRFPLLEFSSNAGTLGKSILYLGHAGSNVFHVDASSQEADEARGADWEHH